MILNSIYPEALQKSNGSVDLARTRARGERKQIKSISTDTSKLLCGKGLAGRSFMSLGRMLTKNRVVFTPISPTLVDPKQLLETDFRPAL
jgi:hypothetical protein